MIELQREVVKVLVKENTKIKNESFKHYSVDLQTRRLILMSIQPRLQFLSIIQSSTLTDDKSTVSTGGCY